MFIFLFLPIHAIQKNLGGNGKTKKSEVSIPLYQSLGGKKRSGANSVTVTASVTR